MSAWTAWEALGASARKAVLAKATYTTEEVRAELEEHGLVVPGGPSQVRGALGGALEWTPLADKARWMGAEDMVRSYDHLRERLCYFAECEMATIETMRGVKRTSKYELGRHESIFDKMLADLRQHRVTAKEARDWKCGRVAESLEDRAAGSKEK